MQNGAEGAGGAPGAPVSMPLTWEELAKAHPLDFRITNAPERLAQTGDRWREALTRKQSLERALERAKAENRGPNPLKRGNKLGGRHGRTIDRYADGFVWDGLDSGEAFLRHRGEPRHFVQPPAQDLRIAVEAAVHLRKGRGAGRPRRHGEGLRVRKGSVRDVLARGAESARGGGHAHGGHRGIRADRIDRPRV